MAVSSHIPFRGYTCVLIAGSMLSGCGDRGPSPSNAGAGGSFDASGTGGYGPPVAAGPPAASGASGAAGTAGSTATAGQNAAAGGVGAQGEAGTAGVAATGGTAGVAATGGTAGVAATGGTAGMAGTGGTAGVAATGGTAGMAGTGGTAGTAGTGGTAGTAATGGTAGTAATGGTAGTAATGGNVSDECGGFDSAVYFCDGRDGQLYKWVHIGTQTWMAENLNYGTQIAGSSDQTASGQKYCYDDAASNCDTFGGLYQWALAMGLDNSCNNTSCLAQLQGTQRGVCPEGWHVPSNNEWSALKEYVDANNGDDDMAYSLKATDNWATNPNTGNGGPGNDAFGFTALAGGGRYTLGYSCAGRALTDDDYFCWGGRFRGMFWSAEEDSATMGCIQDISDDQPGFTRMCGNPKVHGFSVRCVKD